MENFKDKSLIFLPRQSLPVYYWENGAIYIMKTQHLQMSDNIDKGQCYAYIMEQSHSDSEFSEDRDKAIEWLKNQEINVVFSVDMYNEGVDIVAVDMVMFLRPTESPIVFCQQLGRGFEPAGERNF